MVKLTQQEIDAIHNIFTQFNKNKNDSYGIIRFITCFFLGFQILFFLVFNCYISL